MKKVTKIERQKKNKDRISIFLDDEFAFGLDEGVFLDSGICKYMELEEEYIEETLKKEDYRKAENYAIYLISQREYTEKKLRDKILSKGFSEEQSDRIVNKFEKYGYIDDENYAERFVRTKQKVSKHGKYKIKSSLYEKGIDKDIINRCMSEFDEDIELENAKSFVIKKANSLKSKNLDKYKLKQKITAYLASKGYGYEIIKKAINSCGIEEEDYEI